MNYMIKKEYQGTRFKFYAVPKPSFLPSLISFKYPRYSPDFDTPEEVIDYMDKILQECLIDPKTIKPLDELR